MSAGTIKLTNGSQAVTGTGTVFQTDLKQGDVIYAEINGTPYNVIVGSVESDTSLTLVDKFSGPTAVSLPWMAMPARLMGKISQQMTARISSALINSENALNAFQMLLTQTGDVTITAINGQQFTGASWQKITKLVNDANLSAFTSLANQINTQYNQIQTWTQNTQSAAQTSLTARQDAINARDAAAGSAQTASNKAQEAAASAAAGKASQDAARTSELNAAQYDSNKALVNRGNMADDANINNFGPSQRGTWFKTTLTNADNAHGFPASGMAGIVEVFDGGYNGLTQRFTAFANPGSIDSSARAGFIYIRCLTGAWNGGGPWGPWMKSSFDTPDGSVQTDYRFRVINRPGISASFEWQNSSRDTTVNVSLDEAGNNMTWNYSAKFKSMNFNNMQLINAGYLTCNGNIEGNALWGWGNLTTRITPPAGAPNNTYLSSPSLKAMFWGRGGYGDPSGAYFGMYHQEYVGNFARGILNLNGYGVDRNWLFYNDGRFEGPMGIIQGSGSDVRLKDEITPAAAGAGERIDQLGLVEFTERDTKRRRRGFISQQLDSIDPLYTAIGGETTDENDKKYEILNVDDRAVIADVVAALQEARSEIRALKDRVKELEG